jgi:nucleoside-diphosphate-sugar epimerase
MKILISGATGFLGKHVLKQLSQADHEVFLIVRSREHSLAMNREYPSFTIYEYDYRKIDSEFVSIGNFDVFLNLAWSNLDDFQSSDHLSFELPAQKEFVTQIISRGVKSIVSVGTCLEYSKLQGELREDSPCGTEIPYAMAKNQLKNFLRIQSELDNFNLTWVRLFYFYGPGQPERTLFGQLVSAANQHQQTFDTLTNGLQKLDYMHVEDVAKSLVQILLTGQAHGEVNLCSGQARTLRDITSQWIKDFQWDVRISWGNQDFRTYESDAFWGSTDKLTEILTPVDVVAAYEE